MNMLINCQGHGAVDRLARQVTDGFSCAIRSAHQRIEQGSEQSLMPLFVTLYDPKAHCTATRPPV